MKIKLQSLGVILIALLLSGCSVVEDVTQSLNYTDEASQFINETVAFANQVPQLAQEAANNSDILGQLNTQLDQMKQSISEFNGLEAPAFAQNFHEQLTSYNETLSQQIDEYSTQIQNGVTDFKNTEMAQTLGQIEGVLEQLRGLGE
ncbi:DUF6376 family protein [Paenibacillus lemnae]|uniref:Lipoprotein n=1 Tax=Paenibacillus lemnae TaxID=1330551 RepID=A0A848M6X4_PAELE|nr:DUF6376 family protein [Paenibacillus lemnae]NMO96386.1 hypothetical protein [Paenibacillus lemnae]